MVYSRLHVKMGYYFVCATYLNMEPDAEHGSCVGTGCSKKVQVRITDHRRELPSVNTYLLHKYFNLFVDDLTKELYHCEKTHSSIITLLMANKLIY